MSVSPSTVRWTGHAETRAAQIGWSRADVERAVLGEFASRRRNKGAAAWRVEARGAVFVFDWPDGDDLGTARLVTLWNRR